MHKGQLKKKKKKKKLSEPSCSIKKTRFIYVFLRNVTKQLRLQRDKDGIFSTNVEPWKILLIKITIFPRANTIMKFTKHVQNNPV